MKINEPCISSTVDEYGPVHVYQSRTSLILSFDGKIYQSSMKLNNVNGLALDYTQAMMTGLMFIPKVKTATIMGLGGGSMAKNLLSSFSDLTVHAVEYREEVVKVAKEYFHLPETDRLVIHLDEAANYLKNTDVKSDVIFSDLYRPEGMDPKQVHSSYLRDCKNALNQHGVLVLNICHTALNSQDEFDGLLALEFENRLLSFEVEGGNSVVLAFKNKIPSITGEELLAKAKYLQGKMNIELELYAQRFCDAHD
jgi:spermidine synthase